MRSLTAKLVALCLVFGVLPATVLGTLAYRAAGALGEGTGLRFQEQAANLADLVDRNLAERYGDAQAFALNGIIGQRDAWYQRGDASPIVTVMDHYVATYEVYALTLLVDPAGRLIAVNSRDPDKRPIDSAALYERDYSKTPWFQALAAGGSKSWTFVEGVHADPDVASVTKDGHGLTLGFSAPVRGPDGKVIAYWSNRARFDLVEQIFSRGYEAMKRAGYPDAELTLLDPEGRVIVDLDGKVGLRHDLEKVIGKLNLAQLGVAGAKEALGGASGYAVSHHARKGIDQLGGYAHSKGALGFPGMGWSTLVRMPVEQALAATISTRRKLFIGGVACLVVTLFAGLFVARRFAAPVVEVTHATQRIIEGDTSSTIEHRSTDELGTLADALRSLIDVTRQQQDDAAAETERAREAEFERDYGVGVITVSSHQERTLVERHGLTVEDLGVVAAFGDTLRDAIPTVVDEFYAAVMAAPELRAIIEKHSSVERQRPILTRYLGTLLHGRIDDGYLRSRRHVGAVHDRVDLDIPAVVAAYTQISRGFAEAVARDGTPAEQRRFERAFQGLTRLDISLLADGLLTSRKQTVDRLIEDASNRAAEAGMFIAAVGEALEELAKGDLRARVEGEFESLYAELVGTYDEATTELNRTLLDVDRASHEVSAASREIESASQSLATASAQSAASIEEVTHGLAEVSRVSRRNAEHARDAGALAREARQSVEDGQQHVETLGDAIEAIKDSADKTSKIVHAIDEIAFQTNLLALNAAVEAARAGEAGAGFTVVAEEVRALAMRSAEAAKSTAELIDDAVNNAVRGVAISAHVHGALEDIGARVQNVDEVMHRIVDDAVEQETVITQSEQALDQVNGATQRNAATTEETATAAAQLNSQADSLLHLVRRFQLERGQAVRAAWRQGA